MYETYYFGPGTKTKNTASFKPNETKPFSLIGKCDPINLYSTNSEFHVIQPFIHSLNKVPTLC